MKPSNGKPSQVLCLLAGILLFQMAVISHVHAKGGNAAASSTGSGSTGQAVMDVDWSKAVVESTIKRNPDPPKLGRWQYPAGALPDGPVSTLAKDQRSPLL